MENAVLDPSVESARSFAIQAHGSQRYGSRPFEHHLDSVVNVLVAYDAPLTQQQAGYLHDVLEDTQVTFAQLVTHFGLAVATMVWGLSVEDGDYASAYARMAEVGVSAITVKVADRISNVRAVLESYFKEENLPRMERLLEKYTKDFPLLSHYVLPYTHDSARLHGMFKLLTLVMEAAKDPQTWKQRRSNVPSATVDDTSDTGPAGNGASALAQP